MYDPSIRDFEASAVGSIKHDASKALCDDLVEVFDQFANDPRALKMDAHPFFRAQDAPAGHDIAVSLMFLMFV